MALLFVGGVMNVLWITTLAILVLAEKVIPAGRLISRISGAGFIAGGVWLLAAAPRTAFFSTDPLVLPTSALSVRMAGREQATYRVSSVCSSLYGRTRERTALLRLVNRPLQILS
jgi:hypothetical protein